MRIGRDADADVARALDAAATFPPPSLPSEQRQRAKAAEKGRRRRVARETGERRASPFERSLLVAKLASECDSDSSSRLS